MNGVLTPHALRDIARLVDDDLCIDHPIPFVPVVEGNPVDVGVGRVDVVAGYMGTVELFERAGFHRAAPTTGHSGGRPRFVMRKELC